MSGAEDDIRESADTLVRPGERVDDLMRGGYRIIQDPGRFCFGMDAVLLSAFAKTRPGDKVLDLGCGNGIIPLLMHARNKRTDITGLEISQGSADLARRSVRLNGVQDHIHIVTGDVRNAAEVFPAASFDIVTSNPPYMTAGEGLLNPDPEIAAARHELRADLGDFIAAAKHVLKNGGSFYLVHRPFRLTQIISLLHGAGLEPKTMRLVYPYTDREPNLVLISCIKGGGAYLRVQPPLIVYDAPGKYTREVLEMYGRDTLSGGDAHRES